MKQQLPSLKNPFRFVPKPMLPFVKAGKVDDIFRPRILGNGIFATTTGYGTSFTLEGVDSEGLDRSTLNHLSKQIAVANRVLPSECLVYEYLILTPSGALPARPIANPVVSEQARGACGVSQGACQVQERPAHRHALHSLQDCG